MDMKKYFSLDHVSKLTFNTFLILPGIAFLFIGFIWLVAPDKAASLLLMPLLSGAGLGSQIGDIGGMFLAMGLLVMGAVTFRRSDLLMSVAVLLTCIVIYRILSFTLHEATLALQMVVFESIVATWFYVASRKLKQKESSYA